MTCFLKSWSNRFVGNIRLQLAIAKEIKSRLEAVDDRRSLAAHEDDLQKEMKLKIMGVSSLRHTISRQESRLVWPHEGDVPTQFFHAHANVCRRRNQIGILQHEGHSIVFEEAKVVAFFDFFDGVLATPPSHSRRLKLEQLDLLCVVDLAGLDYRFTEDEVWSIIMGLPPDKAPGPDGFIARFLQAAWPVIHHDIMCAFDAFWRMDIRHLHCTNDVIMVLLPKKVYPEAIKDL
jgi:hypothetical protein